MAELGTRASGATSGDGNKSANMSDGLDRELRTHEFEQVAIETVHVGDYLLIATHPGAGSTRCVIRKCAKTNERTARVVGWLVELADGHHAWWPRGELVWRRRTSVRT